MVVPTYGRAVLLGRLIAALEAQTLALEHFEVLVVDDCSHDDTWTVLAALTMDSPLRLRPLRVEENRGPAHARNLGWKEAVAPIVAFTDDDCTPRPDWLEQGLTTCRASPGLGVLQGATLRPPGHPPIGPLTLYRETLDPSPYFEGGNLFFPRTVLERIGGFDEVQRWYGEDTAAGWAAIATGGEWVFDETAVVYHDVVERPLRWHLFMAWREGGLVDVAVRHPAMRDRTFWRPWAHRPVNVAFVAALAGLAWSIRWPPAAFGALWWLWLRRPPLGPGFSHTLAIRFAYDAAVCVGMTVASARNRTFVL